MNAHQLQPRMDFAEIANELGISCQAAMAAYRSGMRKLEAHGMTEAFPMVAALHCKREHAVAPLRRRVEPVRLAVN